MKTTNLIFILGTYVSSPYTSNFIPQSCQPLPTNTSTSDLVPVFPQHPVQVVYPTPQGQILYPNQGIVYAQNPLYPNPVLPSQNINYPHSASTPNKLNSSASSTAFCGPMSDSGIPIATQFGQLVQNMNHLNLSGAGSPNGQVNKSVYGGQQFDGRPFKSFQTKLNRVNSVKSQSSTGTNSPANTIVAGCNTGPGLYRTPSETPPIPHMNNNFSRGFVQPLVLRQVN